MSSKRKNSRPVKAEPQHETSSNPKFSVEVKKEIIKSQKRFLFNIEQIEAKYCGSSSGLVLAADNDKVYFEDKLCTAKDDHEFVKLLYSQEEALMQKKFGATFLSTPAVDPDEKDSKMIERWRKINKVFETCFKKDSNAEEKENSNEKKGKEIAIRHQTQVQKSDRKRLHVDNSLIDDLSFSRLYKLERASAIGQFSFLKFPIKAEAIDDREPCGSQQLNSQKLTLCPSEQPSTSSVGALISLAGMQHHPRNKYSRVEYTVEEPPETDDEIRSQAYGYGQSNEKTIYNGIQNSDPADV